MASVNKRKKLDVDANLDMSDRNYEKLTVRSASPVFSEFDEGDDDADDDQNDMVLEINNVLPDYLLKHIFQFLSLEEMLMYMKICRYWDKLIRDVLKKKRKLKAFSHDWSCGGDCESDCGMEWERHDRNLQKIERYIVTKHGFKKVVSLCPALTTIDLRKANKSQMKNLQDVGTLVKFCPNLKTVLLPCLHGTKQSINFLKGLTELEVLEIPTSDIKNEDLQCIFGSCKNLRELDMNRNCVTFKAFSNAVPKLQKLVIDFCDGLTRKTFYILLDMCQDSLEHLSASYVWDLSINCLRPISGFANLKHLSLSHQDWKCPNRIPLRCLSSLTSLTNLDLADTRCVHDKDLAAIVGGCTKLRVLDISGQFSCLTSEGLRVLKRAKNLYGLDVSYQNNVDDTCLEVFANFPNLGDLKIRRCLKITNAGLSYLALIPDALMWLDISANEQLENSPSVLYQFHENKQNRKCYLQVNLGGSGLEDAYLEADDMWGMGGRCELRRANTSEYWGNFEVEITSSDGSSWSDDEGEDSTDHAGTDGDDIEEDDGDADVLHIEEDGDKGNRCSSANQGEES